MTQSAVSGPSREGGLGVDILIRERRKEIELTAGNPHRPGTYARSARHPLAVKEIAEQRKRTRPVRYGLAVFPAPAPAFCQRHSLF